MDSKAFILKKDDAFVSQPERKKIVFLAKKIIRGKSLASVVKKKEFYGKTFFVNENVLIPRPEAELIIDAILEKIPENQKISLLDIGFGSGIIPVTIACLYKNSLIDGIDISQKALYVAKKNLEIYKEIQNRVNLMKRDIFDYKPKKKYDVVISNPPYVKTEETERLIGEKIISDPKISLDGGEDGLKFYGKIAGFCDEYLKEGGYVFLEHGMGQSESIKKLFNKNYFLESIDDYSGIDRIICAKKQIVI